MAVMQPASAAGANEPAQSEAPSVSSTSTPAPAPQGLGDILTAAVTDRNQGVLEKPSAAPSLAAGKSTDHFKSNRSKAATEAGARKQRFKSLGFTYTAATSSITVTSWSTSGNTALADFSERTELTLKSDSTGTSSVPSTYTAKETAQFVSDGAGGWTLDQITAANGQVLPMAVVDISDTNPSSSPAAPEKTPGLSSHRAVPGKPGRATDAKSGVSPMINGYDYQAMANYALQWWNGRNGNYPSYDDDCTNFISQSMEAGGWGETTGWYQADTSWWHQWNWNASYPWEGAQNFANFAIGSGRAYYLNYLNDMGVADIEQVNWTGAGNVNHTMIVTYWAYGSQANDIRVTYHTNDSINISIWDLYSAYPNAWWYALRT